MTDLKWPEGVRVECFGGNCPVQAEGFVDGEAFYFRARGNRWTMDIGGDPMMNPEFSAAGDWGDKPYAAGWMPVETAHALIVKAIDEYRKMRALIEEAKQ